MGTFMILAQLFAAFWSAAGTLTRQEEAEGRELIPNSSISSGLRRIEDSKTQAFRCFLASFLGTHTVSQYVKAPRNWFLFYLFFLPVDTDDFLVNCPVVFSCSNQIASTPPISSLPPLLFG
jgi:hypothetical protein